MIHNSSIGTKLHETHKTILVVIVVVVGKMILVVVIVVVVWMVRWRWQGRAEACTPYMEYRGPGLRAPGKGPCTV